MIGQISASIQLRTSSSEVVSITVSLPDKMATVEFNSAITSISAIAKKIADMGYEAENGVVLDALQMPTGKNADSSELAPN